MADLSSAYLFARIFELIDEYVHDAEDRQRLALKFWKETREHDFSPYQMGCNELLMKAGARAAGVWIPSVPKTVTMRYGPEEPEK